MKNMIEICKEFGVEIPTEKIAEFNKKVVENFVTISEHEKKVKRAETERDNWKEKAETAEETLKGFDGVDLQTIQNDLATYKKRAEDAEKEYESKIYARDFEDALKTELEAYTFTSEAAKKSVVADIKAAGLKLNNGKILGLNDLIEQIKTTDASAFVDENTATLEANRAKFTTKLSDNTAPTYKTRAEIMAIKDAAERQAAIGANIKLFGKGD